MFRDCGFGSDAWSHIEEEDKDSVHKSGRWVLCDKENITKTSNSPYETEPLLKGVTVEKVDMTSSLESVKATKNEADDVELLQV